jgi:hypothetical protein
LREWLLDGDIVFSLPKQATFTLWATMNMDSVRVSALATLLFHYPKHRPLLVYRPVLVTQSLGTKMGLHSHGAMAGVED